MLGVRIDHLAGLRFTEQEMIDPAHPGFGIEQARRDATTQDRAVQYLRVRGDAALALDDADVTESVGSQAPPCHHVHAASSIAAAAICFKGNWRSTAPIWKAACGMP